jgi:surfeit locus 1 family protein
MGARIRSLLLPGFVTLLGTAFLLGLGFWQIERMGAKHRLMARVEARAQQEPQPFPPETLWPSLAPKAYEYSKVRLEGRFLHEKEAHVHGLLSTENRGAVQGFYILTPLLLENGAIVIVNRGFVPTERVAPASRSEGQLAGPQTVVGLMRAPERRGWFIPEDDPKSNSWFTRDPAAIGRAMGLERVAPFSVDADATPTPGGLPLGGQTRLVFTDNHLQYAITWFAMALALLGVFAVWARGRLKGED